MRGEYQVSPTLTMDPYQQPHQTQSSAVPFYLNQPVLNTTDLHVTRGPAAPAATENPVGESWRVTIHLVTKEGEKEREKLQTTL